MNFPRVLPADRCVPHGPATLRSTWAWLQRVCLGIFLTVTTAAAQTEPQPIPTLSARVTDTTGTLDAQQRQTLESELAALERRKGSQIAVLIVKTTQPEDIAAYTIRVFDAWKLGRKGIDDGVLLVVAKDDHRVRIEVARGLEGTIPDAAAARIIREFVTPKFRTGDFFGGIHDATLQLTKLVDGEPLTPPRAPDHRDTGFSVFIVGVGIFLALFLRLALFFLPTWIRASVLGGIGGLAWVFTQSPIATLVCVGGSFLIGLIPGWRAGPRVARAGRPIVAAGGSGFGYESNRSDSYLDRGSSSSSSSSYSDSSSSSSSDSFSGGGGESAGGGASGSW